MTKLEENYSTWADSVNLFEKGKNQQVLMTMAFYSGVLVMFTLLENLSKEKNEDKAVQFLDDIHDELKEKLAFIVEQIDELYDKKDS